MSPAPRDSDHLRSGGGPAGETTTSQSGISENVARGMPVEFRRSPHLAKGRGRGGWRPDQPALSPAHCASETIGVWLPTLQRGGRGGWWPDQPAPSPAHCASEPPRDVARQRREEHELRTGGTAISHTAQTTRGVAYRLLFPFALLAIFAVKSLSQGGIFNSSRHRTRRIGVATSRPVCCRCGACSRPSLDTGTARQRGLLRQSTWDRSHARGRSGSILQ